jgi:adenosylmethionine-8-amino-7-oxononanoate aminotransferase
VRAPVYDAFLGAPSELVQFFHGHSYAGNPIACAAALASLELFGEERTLEHAAAIAAKAGTRLAGLQTHRAVREVRQAGTMIGIEVRADGRSVANELYERGHFTRPIGDVVQFVPPLSSTQEEVDAFFDALEAALSS